MWEFAKNNPGYFFLCVLAIAEAARHIFGRK
jgi:hypothetical protein